VLTGCGKNGSNQAVTESVTVAVTDASTTVKEESTETNQKITETKIETQGSKDKEAINSNDVTETKKSDNKDACLKEAQEFMDDLSGYSPKVLKMTLEYDGYTKSEIDYAMDNLKVDWKEQAKAYCSFLLKCEYTRQEAYSELVGWGFTTEEAKSAMAAVYY
jgi:hypothetical protein